VIPGFKKVASVVGAGHGRGFISCRNGSQWLARSASTLDSGNLGVEVGAEEVDLVIVSLDPGARAKLLSNRFVVGADASAAWGNGKSAHEDPNAETRFYGRTKGAFAAFGLDGVTLTPDESGNHALYGAKLSNSQIVDNGTQKPAVGQAFIAALTHMAHDNGS
jgi:SH3 domain-containing YSC84-like protein 1